MPYFLSFTPKISKIIKFIQDKTKGCAPKLERTAFLNAFSDEVNYFSQTTFPLNI